MRWRKETYPFELTKTVRVGQNLPHFLRPRVVHPHGAVHELDAVSLACLKNPVELRHVQGHRLLQQHVLPLLRRHHRPLHVQPRRKRHVHCLHLTILQHTLVAPVHSHRPRQPVIGRKLRSLLNRTAAYGHQRGVWGSAYGLAQLDGDISAAQNTKTHRRLVIRHVFVCDEWAVCVRAEEWEVQVKN